jgi:hypothetical protein
MPGKNQQWSTISLVCPEILDIAERESLDCKSERFETRRQDILTTLITGSNGIDGNKLLCQFESIGHSVP